MFENGPYLKETVVLQTGKQLYLLAMLNIRQGAGEKIIFKILLLACLFVRLPGFIGHASGKFQSFSCRRPTSLSSAVKVLPSGRCFVRRDGSEIIQVMFCSSFSYPQEFQAFISVLTSSQLELNY